MSSDPYRTLGLQPGASMAEVKRAYRRLAKAFHPDSAGEAALPRFLAIHEAYEVLRTGRTGGAVRPRPGPPTAPPSSPGPEPWRADPARARAARERARTTRSRASGTSGTTGAGGTPGASRAPGDSAPGSTASGSARSSGGPGGTRASGPSRGSGRRRETRKATMGSTSYDDARDPSDATWSGASWYGPTTGEYWIVNPREYADPRKHGLDYQSRARRPVGNDPAEIDEPDDAGPAPKPTSGWAPTGSAPAPEAELRARDAGAAPLGADEARRRARAQAWPSWDTVPERGAASAASGRARPGDAWSSPAWRPPSPAAARDWLGGPADDPIRRLGLALVAWPPIGLAAAAAIGEVTGCSVYAADCGGTDTLLPWLAQAGILGLLLLLPPFARLLAGGTVAVVVSLVPVTAFLVVVGGTGEPQAGYALAFLLALVWLVGIGWSVAMARRRGALRDERGARAPDGP